MRLLKLVAVLLVLILAALAGYAYFGDMSSDPQEMRMPVELDLGVAATAPAPQSPAQAGGQNDAQGTAAPEQGAATGQDDLD